ncbi:MULTISPECIES: hypothetical protein [unclassified Nocardioides]|uniref:hypothetical protein n=1 Tax=unclassified Nocardioides TaxID=2615069 RepID=UPI002666B6FE|nr:hypothetical protein [Nocardioides sp. Arc9.136]WKN47692.1 hypothetical protein OSR43_16835 [Nocardioides sp. Arc9.136]
MGEQGPGEVTESFRPTSGRVSGVLGLLAALGAVVLGVTERYDAAVVVGAVFFGVLVWAATLRPRVLVAHGRLVLRNMLETVTIPLAAVEELGVRQVLAVRAGEKRYVSPAIGQTLRSTLQTRASSTPGGTDPDLGTPGPSYADIVEMRIRQLVDEDRTARGIRRSSPEVTALAAEVRRTPAWAEIVLLAVTFVGFLVTLVL